MVQTSWTIYRNIYQLYSTQFSNQLICTALNQIKALMPNLSRLLNTEGSSSQHVVRACRHQGENVDVAASMLKDLHQNTLPGWETMFDIFTLQDDTFKRKILQKIFGRVQFNTCCATVYYRRFLSEHSVNDWPNPYEMTLDIPDALSYMGCCVGRVLVEFRSAAFGSTGCRAVHGYLAKIRRLNYSVAMSTSRGERTGGDCMDVTNVRRQTFTDTRPKPPWSLGFNVTCLENPPHTTHSDVESNSCGGRLVESPIVVNS